MTEPMKASASRPRIGIFDSGVGGLTVLRGIIDLLPGCDTVYFGDTGRFPYGPKPAEDVRQYAHQIAAWLVEQSVDLIVIACNSATAVALTSLKAELPVPVIGVIEPGVRAAARASSGGRVGVIATVGTVRSGAYQETAAAVAPQLQLTCWATPGFVEFVEAGEVESEQLYVLAERLLMPLQAAEVDTLVLGCTHYPLIARCISAVMGPQVVLVSSAEETAFAVLRSAIANEWQLGAKVATHRFVTSGDPAQFARLAAMVIGPEVKAVETHAWT